MSNPIDSAPDWHKANPIERPLGWYFADHPRIMNALGRLGCEYMADVVVLPDDLLTANGFSYTMRATFRQITHQVAGISRPDYDYVGMLALPAELKRRLWALGIHSVRYLASLSKEELTAKKFDARDKRAIAKALKAYESRR